MTSIPLKRETIPVPDDVTVAVDGSTVEVEGPEGTTSRQLEHPEIRLELEDGDVEVFAEHPTRQVAALVGTFAGHVRNMVQGAHEGYEAELRVVSSHFPIKARVEDDEVVIGNFLGEKAPRRARVLGDTEVQVDGEDVLVRGPDKEAVGQTAVNIERATDTSGYDPRVFQDGIYLTRKPS